MKQFISGAACSAVVCGIILLLTRYCGQRVGLLPSRVEQAVRIRDGLQWEGLKKYGVPHGWSEKELLDERARNMKARINDAPSIAEITAARLSCVSNTGDLVIYLQAIDRVYELTCRGHAAEAKLLIDSVEQKETSDLDFGRQSRESELKVKQNGDILQAGEIWMSYPQLAGDNSPPVFMPRYSLRVELDKKEYQP